MENLVAVELKRRGCEFYYYLLKERNEIDFVIRENRKISEVLPGYLGKQRQQAQESNPGLMGILTGLLDKNKDGSALDDVIGMVGSFFRGNTSSTPDQDQ